MRRRRRGPLVTTAATITAGLAGYNAPSALAESADCTSFRGGRNRPRRIRQVERFANAGRAVGGARSVRERLASAIAARRAGDRTGSERQEHHSWRAWTPHPAERVAIPQPRIGAARSRATGSSNEGSLGYRNENPHRWSE